MKLFSNRSNLARPLWRKYCKYIYYTIVILYLFSLNANAATAGGEKKATGRYKVATFDYHHVADIYSIALWILLGALVKIGK
jgi:uncharacterized membrane protein